jgi:glycosyltransferase involved in cell wall biosynthesis
MNAKISVIIPTKNRTLAEKIIYLIEHPEEGKRMGKAGRRLVEEQFTWDMIVERTIRLYKNLLGDNGR